MISSTLLALNYRENFDELENADCYFTCVIQENLSINQLCEINQYLQLKRLGSILPIYCEERETAFTVITDYLEKSLEITKNLLWENGVVLSSEIYLVKPEIKVLKEYGKR